MREEEDEEGRGDDEYLRKVRWNKLNVRHSAMAEMPILPSRGPGIRRDYRNWQGGV